MTQKNSTYVDRLEEKIEQFEQREKDWQALASEYGHLVRKFQLGKTINMQNWNDIQKLKNKLGIGNGVLKSE